MTTAYPFRFVCGDDHAYLSGDAQGNLGTPLARERPTCSLTIGKTYEVLGEDLGLWAVIDDTGESCLFPKSRFERIGA